LKGFDKNSYKKFPSVSAAKVKFILVCFTCLLTGLSLKIFAQSSPVIAGYRDFYYGPTVNSTPTGERPESKLWWNDGSWWGILWDDTAAEYRIYRYDPGNPPVVNPGWINTAAGADSRVNAKCDILWDQTVQKLYLVSHIYTSSGTGGQTSSQSAKFWRYGYDSITQTYINEIAAVDVNDAKTETLVITRDSAGKLWVTWMEDQWVKVNTSTNDGASWGTPFILPVMDAPANADDICSIISFAENGNGRVGIMWSDQDARKNFFAVHNDSDPDTTWQPREDALGDGVSAYSDDHINLTAARDGSGEVYAAVKTSLAAAADPLVLLLKRSPAGTWTRYEFGNVQNNHTRPIALIDSSNREIYLVAMVQDNNNDRTIYYKSASMDSISFAPGLGSLLIQSPADKQISNPTSTRQPLNKTTGMLVLVSDQDTRYYLHNYIVLFKHPLITSFSLSAGPVGSALLINGKNFANTTNVAFNDTVEAAFTIISASQIEVTVPEGASTGFISVTNPYGTATSEDTFTVSLPPFQLTLNIAGSGAVELNPPGGSYDTITVVTLTATPDSGYGFTGWSGDLNSTANPDSIIMNIDKTVTAAFTELPRYTLTLDTIGSGGIALDPPGGIYYQGTIVTLTATPDSGSAFSGWSGDLSGLIAVDSIVMNGDKNVTAAFTRQFALTINTFGAGTVNINPPQGIYDSTSVVSLTAVADSGYKFNGWSGDFISAANPDSILMDSDKTITATFTELPQYTLTVDTVGAGDVMLNPPGAVYYAGTSVILIAVPDSGNVFKAWSGDLSSTTNPDSLTMDGNKSVTATFTRQFSLATTTVGGGSVFLNPPGGFYDSLTVVTFTATADSGWIFAGWSGDLSGIANPDSLVMNGNKSVTATFTRQFSLTSAVTGGGRVTIHR
jgi:hypothetical protein